MLVLHKTSSDPSVVQFVPPMDIPTRLRRRLKRRLLERAHGEIAARHAGSTFFSDDRSQHHADVLRQLPVPDVLNLHWVANFIDYRALFRELPRGLPMVWTLHDMNSFTGGCHYDEACGKFHRCCGECPQLGSSNPGDLSSQVWLRKREAFSSHGGRNVRLVTPSRWLADEAAKSSLLSGRTLTVIPYGVDTECFQPRDRELARQKYGIPMEAKTILFVADSTGEKRKGLRILLKAIAGLESSEEYFSVVIGHEVDDQILSKRCKVIDFLDDETALSFVYSAADVFVIPSLQDNLPNTAIEALACGIPTIGSSVGGIPELVRDGQTGILVSPMDAVALREAITALLKDRERLASMAKESRRVALREYGLGLQAQRYADVYQQGLGAAGIAGS
jgi:glycosyltransferase involved in cell wall biosynthesis